jgi:hypothetical protein
MLPIETKLSIPTEISSLQNTTLPDENQSQTSLLSSTLNKHRRRNGHRRIPSALIRAYIAPYEPRCSINNRMMPYGYYLQPGQYVVNNNGNIHPVLPFSVSLNPTFTSLGSGVSIPTHNSVPMSQTAAKMQLLEFNSSMQDISDERTLPAFSSQDIEYENLIQSCDVTNQHHMLMQPYSLPAASSSLISTPVVPPPKTKRSKSIYHSQLL